jgi:pyruvate/2-oxoglutarate dehydrogenase complex dihydrolipoamide acyltransferase (E2) component
MMPKLVLQLDDRVLKEYDMGTMATIGRLSDNSIAIDSPAVSSHHACVFRDGDQFVVEDLQSTNGTFVNGTRVSRHALQSGDVVRVGKHQLVLDQEAGAQPVTGDPAEQAAPNQGDTMFLDAKSLLGQFIGSEAQRKYEALSARLLDIEAHANAAKAAAAESAAERTNAATLRVLAGRAERSEYTLESHTSVIGKSKSSAVRLRGWFKPKMAVAITRNRQGYVATLLGGSMHIKGQSVRGRHELKDGDVLEVSGLVLEFRLKQSTPPAVTIPPAAGGATADQDLANC